MFASCSLAARIEAVEARLTKSVVATVMKQDRAAFAEPIAGGVAAYAGPFSPMSKVIGVGFAGVPAVTQLRELEARFHEWSAPVSFEVSTLADPALVTLLSREGYHLAQFENVLGRPLEAADSSLHAPGVEIVPFAEGDTDEWIDSAITAFEHADERGVAAPALPPREVLDAALRPFVATPGFRRYVARVGERIAGTATLRIDDGVAQLCGAATLPAYRRRGIHAALLARRLADSVAAGCKIAVITTQPGSTSQENASKKNFSLLYARAVLVKESLPY